MNPGSLAGARTTRSTPAWTPRELILWVALGGALSASWVDLARHWAAEPWARPAALFLPLLLEASARDRSRRPPHGDGVLLVVTGLLLSLVALGGGIPRFGRPGVPLAVIGMARALGRPSLASALLAVWVIPPPHALLVAVPAGLERAIPWLAAMAARARDLPVTLGPHALDIAGATLALAPADGGVPLALYMAGVGWWGVARSGGGSRRAAVAALRMAPLGLVAQALALGLACLLLAAAAPHLARACLDLVAWPALALALAWTGMRQPGGADR